MKALESVHRNPPDLVLSDVMMPRLDGFGLLRALREDPRTAEVPVMLLSARAGEEAQMEGLAAGADDYLVKPFSARELLTRVDARLELARIRAESAARLREAQERLQLALSTARMAAWSWDPASDETLMSDSGSEVFGLEPGVTLASAAQSMQVVHPDDRERHRLLIAQAVAKGDGWHGEFRIIRPRDGQIAWLEERALGTWDDETGRARITGLVWDITDRKTAESERERLLASERSARSEAEAAVRARDKFLSIASHELRTPVAAILGSTQLLQRRAARGELIQSGHSERSA